MKHNIIELNAYLYKQILKVRDYFMKRFIAIITSMIIITLFLVGCNSNTNNSGDSHNETEATTEKKISTSNFTEDYIISCLKKTDHVIAVEAVTASNDPNDRLNTKGGYYTAIYFSLDFINQEDVFGDTLIDKGTDAGGCIEAYKTHDDALNRDKYLSTYDNNWLLNSGYHTVVDTLVIRTAIKLTENEHSDIENQIINILMNNNDL